MSVRGLNVRCVFGGGFCKCSIICESAKKNKWKIIGISEGRKFYIKVGSSFHVSFFFGSKKEAIIIYVM